MAGEHFNGFDDPQLAYLMGHAEAPLRDEAARLSYLSVRSQAEGYPDRANELDARANRKRVAAEQAGPKLELDFRDASGVLLATWYEALLEAGNSNGDQPVELLPYNRVAGGHDDVFSDLVTRRTRETLLQIVEAGKPQQPPVKGHRDATMPMPSGDGFTDILTIRRLPPVMGVEIVETRQRSTTTTGPREGEPPRIVWAARKARPGGIQR